MIGDMLRYAKGARAERELLSKFQEMGYSIIRSAGSGVNSVSPDVIAIKNGRGISLECKAWDKGSIAIELDKFSALNEWEKNTLMATYIAWRMNNEGWYFIKLDEMSQNERSCSITRKRARTIGRRLDDIIDSLRMPRGALPAEDAKAKLMESI